MSQVSRFVQSTGAGSGTVTSISAGTGITLTPDPITSTGTIALTVPVTVPHGGTSQTTLLNHGVLLGAGTSAVNSAAVGVSGSVLIGANTAGPSFNSLTSTAGSITYTAGANTLNLDLKNYVSSSTWTPVLSFGSGTTGITYSNQQGRYYRIGNLVFFDFRFILTSKGSSTGSMSIDTLPVAAASGVNFAINFRNTNISNSNVYYGLISGTSVTFYTTTSGNPAALLTNTSWANNSSCFVWGTYFA